MPNLSPYTYNRRKNALNNYIYDNRFAHKDISNNNFKLDVKEENDCYIIEAELPGTTKENIKVELSNGRLTIGVEQKEEINNDFKKYIHKERHYSSMQRSINLSNVKSEGISAKLDNGLLIIQVQKDEQASKLNRVEVQ